MAYRSAMPGAGLFGGASRARADIQGLRAIAVGGVVLFHVRPGWFPGGFVGVDVFFVISGFLITGSLLREAATSGTVQVLKFWARRIRRLMPAATTGGKRGSIFARR
jgi:peptidoglycan/LPS O-acetylase OafA/YrhL